MLKLFKTKKDAEEEQKIEAEKTAQEWFPIKSIEDLYMYREDKYIVMALRIEPVNLELFSKNELKNAINNFKMVLDKLQVNEHMQIVCIGKPINLNSHIQALEEQLKQATDIKKRRILQMYRNQAVNMSASGEVLERRFYIIKAIENDKYAKEELYKKMKEIEMDFNNANIKVSICTEEMDIDLIKNFTHPASTSLEKTVISVFPPTAKEI